VSPTPGLEGPFPRGEDGPIPQVEERPSGLQEGVQWTERGPTIWTEDGPFRPPFGWTTRGCMVFVAAVLGVSLAVAGTLIAVYTGGSSPHAPLRVGEHTASIGAPPKQTYAINTIYDGAFGYDPQGNTTEVSFGFTLVNPVPGNYTATMVESPSNVFLSATGTAAAGPGNPIWMSFTATQFGDFNQLKVIAPNGTPIALGPVAAKLPLHLNAQTDVLTNYDPTALKTPIPGPPASSAEVAKVTTFETRLFHDLNIGDVNDELHTLNPQVIRIFGLQQCQSSLPTLTDPTAKITVKDVTGPSSYDYTVSGVTTRIPNTFYIDATLVLHGQPIDQVVHVANIRSGSDTWFTNCGAPLKKTGK
jgi:hypothetical protein